MDENNVLKCTRCDKQAVVFEDNPENRYCEECINEAKYHRDKHVLEMVPKLLTDDPVDKNTAVVVCGVKPENFDRLKKEKQSANEQKSLKEIKTENKTVDFTNEEKDDQSINEEEIIKKLFGLLIEIKKVLKKYIDTEEQYYDLISLWIIGTITHSVFSSYPFLFLNATKGSGKSRLIKLIVSLSNNGRLIMDLTEAVLFRTAKGSTLGIDEFENIISKDKSTLRTLLNAAYKKGVKVARMTKVKNKEGENMIVEEFEVYAPIVMANINGMDNVLSDRCITIILERSSNELINRLIEDFENDNDIINLKKELGKLKVNLVNLVKQKNIINSWNDYVSIGGDITKSSTPSAQFTQEQLKIFENIYLSDIQARHLELFFPLFILASLFGDEFFNKFILTAKQIVNSKKNDDIIASRDVALTEFVSQCYSSLNYIPLAAIASEFREYMHEEDEQYQTITSRWVGKALDRLKLIVEKRRVGKGVEVILNAAKATEKIKLFKDKN